MASDCPRRIRRGLLAPNISFVSDITQATHPSIAWDFVGTGSCVLQCGQDPNALPSLHSKTHVRKTLANDVVTGVVIAVALGSAATGLVFAWCDAFFIARNCSQKHYFVPSMTCCKRRLPNNGMSACGKG